MIYKIHLFGYKQNMQIIKKLFNYLCEKIKKK